jgi:hypothetical protein
MGETNVALRILTGIIDVKDAPKEGQVTVGFDPHEKVSGSDNTKVTERKTIGGAGRFVATPAKFVALRQVIFDVQDPPPFSAGGFTRFNINDTITRDNLVVDYKATRLAFVEEISYMVIGEVE